MKNTLFVFTLLITATATAQLPPTDTSRLQQLYSIITEKLPANATGGMRWPHRTILYEAAGIKGNPPDTVVGRVLQMAWQRWRKIRISTQDQPPIYFHAILKESLKAGYGVLLLDAVRWGIDLNEMDLEQYHTLLNDLEEAYQFSDTEQRRDWLREYKEVLLSGGARYYSDISFHMRMLAKRYSKIRPPVYGFYAVQKKGKWGFIRENNRVAIPLIYQAVRYNTAHTFEVSKDGKTFVTISLKP